MEGAVMIRADSFLLHEKSKTPPQKGGVFTSLDGLRRTRTLSQLNKYTSQWWRTALPPVGAAEGCDLLILIFSDTEFAEEQNQKIAACGSSYRILVVALRFEAWAQITRRRSSSAERHSRISSTWRKHPRQTFCSSSRQTPLHGDGTAPLTLL
jgi:hypothetical protein